MFYYMFAGELSDEYRVYKKRTRNLSFSVEKVFVARGANQTRNIYFEMHKNIPLNEKIFMSLKNMQSNQCSAFFNCLQSTLFRKDE